MGLFYHLQVPTNAIHTVPSVETTFSPPSTQIEEPPTHSVLPDSKIIHPDDFINLLPPHITISPPPKSEIYDPKHRFRNNLIPRPDVSSSLIRSSEEGVCDVLYGGGTLYNIQTHRFFHNSQLIQHATPNTQYQTPNTKHQTPNNVFLPTVYIIDTSITCITLTFQSSSHIPHNIPNHHPSTHTHAFILSPPPSASPSK
ncbi:hypothetical protein EYC84_008345 [Monilinia fructicola]|uniref:Uncharacterized protein n=1 Tax=Monilinia fructicola TaxID=38448 RepID=A0A5M9JIT7_MONFR|nr:hypothetical protein EYC84_008345 [Monilinia fructicola]